ncbi:hypothetical protein QQP08_014120 [Theobroma cacao]|nr:hypothetical protein QQP08_014120 [Theobroma cacao]
MESRSSLSYLLACAWILFALSGLATRSESAQQAFKRDPGHPHWHHSAFLDVRDSVRSDVGRMLHTRAEVPFQVPLEVNVVLIGLNGDGGYRYTVDAPKLEEFLRVSFPSHRPSCQETGEPLDIKHHVVYNTFPAGQPELIALEKALKEAMVPAGTARESDFGREVPLFEVDATAVEPIFQKLYSYIFDIDNGGYSAKEMDRPVPTAIFIVNFDKVRMDPRNKEIDLDSLMYSKLTPLTEEDMKKQEGDYIYRYRYNGGGASQVWLGSGRFVVIDLSAGPCTYGKIETEEGSVSPRTLPRIRSMILPRGLAAVSDHTTHDNFMGHLAALIATTVEHVIAPDVRGLICGYSILQVKKLVHDDQEVVIIGGSHALHRHEKLAIAVSKAMRGHSLQETKKDGRFHVHTKTYLDGAILKEEMEHSADVLAAGLLEMADPSLSNKFFLRQHWMDESEGSTDSVLKHKPLWAAYYLKSGKDKKKKKQMKKGDLHPTYGTRVIPVFVLSLADVDPQLMMEDDSLVWASNDVVIVLEHQSEKIPLSYVSETERRHAIPSQAQRHILAGLASAVGGLSAPYEKASHIHERPVVNWLWAAGCHPFGPFSNTSQISQMLQDAALVRLPSCISKCSQVDSNGQWHLKCITSCWQRNMIYARVDSALRIIRETSEAVQSFAAQYLKTPLGEPVKGKKNKTTTELWLEKFYKKTTNMPEPFPHELVERLEKYSDNLEEQLVDLSSLLYDHRLRDAHLNSSDILQSTMFTQQYVQNVLTSEKDKMRCCQIEFKYPVHSSQTFVYGGILLAGFFVYFVVIFFSSPPGR